eukprot:2620976-Karenia_brevis.AAC.1
MSRIERWHSFCNGRWSFFRQPKCLFHPCLLLLSGIRPGWPTRDKNKLNEGLCKGPIVRYPVIVKYFPA